MRFLFTVLLFSIFLCSCSDENGVQSDTLFQELRLRDLGMEFTNTVTNSDNFNIFNYRNFYNGGGVAIGDVNNDGLADVYLTSNMGDNKLYINKGDWKFDDATDSGKVASSGKWSTGAVMVDVNQDGLLDIYVCNAGFQKGKDQKNQLFINQGADTFIDKAEEYGLAENGYTTHAAFFDYDKDGDLDVYLLNNSFIPTNTLNYANQRNLKAEEWPVKDYLKGGGDKLMRNDDGIFKDVSEKAGIYQSLIGFGLGVTVGDMNDDGWDDLYICNDFFERDYLYINNKKGGFEEKLEDYFQHISHSSMGADLQDINNDGLPDLFVTDMMPRSDYRLKTTASFDDINLRNLKVKQGFYNQYMHNTLHVNAKGAFKDIAFQADVAASEWSWGALMFDADNDGLSDLLVCNGIYHDVIDLDFMDFFANDMLKKMALSGKKEEIDKIIENMPSVPVPNQIFRNINGSNFEEVGKEWGLTKSTFSNGAAYGDLDNDGDYDLVINNVNQPLLVYKNNTSNQSLEVELKGPKENPFGVGAKLYLYTDNGVQYRQLYPSHGFQSSVDYKLLFGINGLTVDSIKVIWPDGKSQALEVLNEGLTLDYSNAAMTTHVKEKEATFETKTVDKIIEHKEDTYTDYYNERGLYRMLSKEGPASAYGDINGDGTLDVFIGGAKGQSGNIYLGGKNGFSILNNKPLNDDSAYEDTAASFFDADGDGDLDLMVGSGGNHLKPNDPLLVDRLYINDGKGIFTKSTSFQVKIGMNTSVIKPYDFDNDGDQDLFVGSRSVPMHFGYSPVHFLFENDGKGNYGDASNKFLEGFKGFGMVCDAEVIDLDADGSEELVLVGEWESPRIFKFTEEKFVEQASNLSDLGGWYFAVEKGDINGDDIDDLVFGNTGTNCYLSADSNHPIKLWINDFDNNGFLDKIITYDIDGKDVPMHQKRDLADQVVSIKKKSMKHHDYAGKSIQDLFSQEILDKCKVKKVNKMESFVALSVGNGNFKIQDLPVEAQASSIKSILLTDVDNDSDLDMLLGGNDFNLMPQLSRLDASYGALLENDKGELTFIPEYESGVMVKGEVKNIMPVKEGAYLFVRNGMKPAMVSKRSK